MKTNKFTIAEIYWHEAVSFYLKRIRKINRKENRKRLLKAYKKLLKHYNLIPNIIKRIFNIKKPTAKTARDYMDYKGEIHNSDWLFDTASYKNNRYYWRSHQFQKESRFCQNQLTITKDHGEIILYSDLSDKDDIVKDVLYYAIVNKVIPSNFTEYFQCDINLDIASVECQNT